MKPNKVVLIGDGSVGKKILIRRYCERKFHVGLVATIGIDTNPQLALLLAVVVKLPIGDMARQERLGYHRAHITGDSVQIFFSVSTFAGAWTWRLQHGLCLD